MHMSDALISPVVGGAMWAVSAGMVAHASKRVEDSIIENRLAYMGVAGAFVFASQMINFAIPGTGSSGHIGGGILLAILLGPHAGFLTMASILFVQALFFADGGLLAYGSNLFNMGVLTSYVAYPLIYLPISRIGKSNPDKRKVYIMIGAVLAATLGLQMGAFGVVLETLLSGRTELPFSTFVMFMQPIHLAIGLIEGAVTAAVAGYLFNQREDMHFEIFSASSDATEHVTKSKKTKKLVLSMALAAILIGGGMSQFASGSPDGLEWSIEKVEALESVPEVSSSHIHELMASLQESAALLPDYDFKSDTGVEGTAIGTSTSGVVGSVLTLLLAGLLGMSAKWARTQHLKRQKI